MRVVNQSSVSCAPNTTTTTNHCSFSFCVRLASLLQYVRRPRPPFAPTRVRVHCYRVSRFICCQDTLFTPPHAAPACRQVGCTRDAFPAWATKVLALGYSVGRVEEVRAPAGATAHDRGGNGATAGGGGGCGGKGGRRGGAGGALLVRRLVRIYTPGTAVDSYFQVRAGLGGWVGLEVER